jgi:hypothetical protein
MSGWDDEVDVNERGAEPVRGDTLYVWQEQEPDGSWGVIVAHVPGLLPRPHLAPLLARSRDVAVDGFGAVAEHHGRTHGRPVRLARFDMAWRVR